MNLGIILHSLGTGERGVQSRATLLEQLSRRFGGGHSERPGRDHDIVGHCVSLQRNESRQIEIIMPCSPQSTSRRLPVPSGKVAIAWPICLWSRYGGFFLRRGMWLQAGL